MWCSWGRLDIPNGGLYRLDYTFTSLADADAADATPPLDSPFTGAAAEEKA